MSLLLCADARALPLPDAYVQTVITSPPYWGLRDYQVAGQIGLDATPAQYVQELVGVFREVRRVLRPDGTLWLNIGDSYANDGKWGGETGGKQLYLPDNDRQRVGRSKRLTGLKPKDLVGIPWMVAFALRADGWYLRSDIIWSKPNPMPESITDRPTKAHEYLFLLSKRPTYYYDHKAIQEPCAASTLREIAAGYTGQATKDYRAAGAQNPSDTKRRIIEGLRRKNEQSGDRRKAGFNTRWDNQERLDASRIMRQSVVGPRRNRRTVWTIPTQPYRGAHFATFPEKLVEPCLLAGSADWEVDHPRSVVLDPFCGSGTVGVVAQRHGRFFIGCDLSLPYLALAAQRLAHGRG